jgi:hypothetical protein
VAITTILNSIGRRHGEVAEQTFTGLSRNSAASNLFLLFENGWVPRRVFVAVYEKGVKLCGKDKAEVE